MPDSIGSYLWKGSQDRTVDEIRQYWSQNVNTTQFWEGDPLAIGTPEFFETVGKFIRKNYAHRYQLINNVAKKYSEGKLLEVGCGAGWELIHWARNRVKTIGIDLSYPALELAKKNLAYHKLPANLVHGNAEELPFDNDTFDIVASFGVLHQAESTENAVSQVHRVLKEDGEAVITLYYKYSWKILLAKLSKLNFEFAHDDSPITRLYGKSELRRLFGDFSSVTINLDYITATKSPRRSISARIFNQLFVPVYNALPKFIRENFGHAAVVLAVK